LLSWPDAELAEVVWVSAEGAARQGPASSASPGLWPLAPDHQPL